MQLDKYLVNKGGMFCALEPGMESWFRRWGAPVDRSIYDTVEMTDEELNALLPQIETMGYSGSDLMLEPSLKEFVLRLKDSSGRGENTVLFRETLMPEAGPVRDGELSRTDRPLLDAYFFFGKGSTADVVVKYGLLQVRRREWEIYDLHIPAPGLGKRLADHGGQIPHRPVPLY